MGKLVFVLAYLACGGYTWKVASHSEQLLGTGSSEHQNSLRADSRGASWRKLQRNSDVADGNRQPVRVKGMLNGLKELSMLLYAFCLAPSFRHSGPRTISFLLNTAQGQDAIKQLTESAARASVSRMATSIYDREEVYVSAIDKLKWVKERAGIIDRAIAAEAGEYNDDDDLWKGQKVPEPTGERAEIIDQAIAAEQATYSMWEEVLVSNNSAGSLHRDEPSESFFQSESVILVENVIPAAERREIIEACLPVAEEERSKERVNLLGGKNKVILPEGSQAHGRLEEAWKLLVEYGGADWSASVSDGVGLIRLNGADIPSTANKLMREVILPRALHMIDTQFPSMVARLFGNAASLVDLYSTGLDGQALPIDAGDQEHTSQLKFAYNEPAINVYTEGGKFNHHQDNQALTVIIPLSEPEDFTGGGTGFWSHGLDANEVAPSLCLRPKAGTAMLWTHELTHSGVTLEAGERVVMVASFTRRAEAEKA